MKTSKLKSNHFETIIDSIDNLPPFPEVAKRVLELSRDPDVNYKDIIDVIKYDEAITANCLKLCNSSYFSLSVKIFSIDQAVVKLGLKNILMIALANSGELTDYSKAQEAYCFSPGELWRHSVTSAIISQLLIKKAKLQDDSALFTAALLHDVGKILINKHIEKGTENLIEFAQKEGLSLIEAEKEVYGFDHAELGGYIAEKWHFPSVLCNSIKNHHNLPEKFVPNIESWVRLSNLVYYVSLDNSVYSYRKGITSQLEKPILSQFKLIQKDIDDVISILPLELKKIEGLLQILL